MSSETEKPSDDDICHTCGQTYLWHLKNAPRHLFSFEADSTAFLGPRRNRDPQRTTQTSQRGAEGPQTVAAPWPFDPVLRQALINRGVITPEDLVTAEASIRAVTATFNNQEG